MPPTSCLRCASSVEKRVLHYCFNGTGSLNTSMIPE